jgi:hypothetical protein
VTLGQEAVATGGARKFLYLEVEVTGRNKLGDRLVEVNCTGEKGNLVAEFGDLL